MDNDARIKELEYRVKASETECERLREMLSGLHDALGLHREDHELQRDYGELGLSWIKDARTALAADQQPDPSVCAKNAHTGEAADQQGEREDETAHGPSYYAGWNAALDEAATITLGHGSLQDKVERIRSLKRGTP